MSAELIPAPARPVATRGLTPRMERYAAGVAAGLSFAEAWRQAGFRAGSVSGRTAQIIAMNQEPTLVQRVSELRRMRDAQIESSFAERAEWLRRVVVADPTEITRVVREACDHCWPDSEVAAAWAAHFAPAPHQEESDRPALPDVLRPRHSCLHCRGFGITRVIVTPTDELGETARALFKQAYQKSDGTVEVELHDQAEALDTLNRMHSSYITRHVNLNVNAGVSAARDIDPLKALEIIEALG